MKNTHFNLRMSESEKKEIKRLAKKSKMNMSEFIRHAIFNKEIVVIDGIDQLRKDLKRIGNNLNQITTRANAGQFHTVYLEETKEEFAKIHDKIAELCVAKGEQVLCETKSTDEESEIDTVEKAAQNQVTHQPNAPFQCISTEAKIQEKNITEKNNIDGEQIVHQDNCHEKSIFNGFGRPKTNSLFGWNRGE